MSAARSLRPTPRPEIMQIDAYVPGKSGAAGPAKIHKLSSNESPLGASPAAIAAFRAFAEQLSVYPDGAATKLRQAIGQRWGLDPALIICGDGSDEILHMLAQVYLGPGDEAVYSQHGFLEYPIVARAAGAKPVAAAETNLTANVDALLGAVTTHTKILFLANPNNPTGTYLSIAEVKRLHAGLPPDVLLVLDAAYAEYVLAENYAAGIELVAAQENVVMARTFSKIYGLANLRLGWAYAPAPIIDALNRVRGPFNVNGAAMAAGIGALEDRAHIDAAIKHNAKWLGWTARQIEALGLRTTPSVGNFLLMHFSGEGARTAAAADAYLTKRGFILRAVNAYGLPHCLRMTIGTAEANEGVVAALTEFMQGAPRAR